MARVLAVTALAGAIICTTSPSSGPPRTGVGLASPLGERQPHATPKPAELANNTAGPWQRCDVVWYGAARHGWKTASGRTFNAWGLSAAHRSLPFGTRVELRYGTRRVVVTVTDRGPIRKTLCFDLSAGAFERLAPLSEGILEGVAWRLLG